MVNITIDEKQLEVAEGTTVLEAARAAGIEIPTLCDHPHLTPYGGCRLCLVEVEGARTLQPSCTMPASNNMVVHTDTQKTRDARKFILTMIFSERNHFCPYCQVSGGDCELQNAAYHEGMTHWSLQPNWKPYPVDASHPFFIQENNRCILCRRCVRACGELVGNFTLGFEERGANSTLVADLGVPLGESSCIGCGTCVQVCPTGALIDRWSAYQGRETEVDCTETICVGCSIGCGIKVLTRDNRLVRIEGNWDASLNEGVICDIGRFHPLIEDRERVQTPLVRKGGSLKAATWDEALDVITTQFKNQKHNQLAGYVSSRLPVEAINVFTQLFAGLGASAYCLEVDLPAEYSSRLADEIKAPFEAKLSSLQTSDCIFVLGEDLTKDHQVVSFFAKRTIPNGTKLITLDNKDNGFDNFAVISLKPKIGTEIDVLRALVSSLKAGKSTFGDVEKVSGLSIDVIESSLSILREAKKPVIVFGKSDSQFITDDFVKILYDLAKQINASLINVKGGANSLAAAQLGLVKSLNTKDIQTGFIVLGDDKPTQQLIKSLEKIPFLIMQSSYISPLTAAAQVVLPAQNWLEQEGHYLSLEGRVQQAYKSLQAEESVRSNFEILNELASKLGIKVNNTWEEQITKRISPVAIELIAD